MSPSRSATTVTDAAPLRRVAGLRGATQPADAFFAVDRARRVRGGVVIRARPDLCVRRAGHGATVAINGNQRMQEEPGGDAVAARPEAALLGMSRAAEIYAAEITETLMEFLMGALALQPIRR